MAVVDLRSQPIVQTPYGRWQPLNGALGIDAVGVNAVVMEPGEEADITHDESESGHQEIYVVVAGRLAFTLGDEELVLEPGQVVAAPDPSVSAATARSSRRRASSASAWPRSPIRIPSGRGSRRPERPELMGDHDELERAYRLATAFLNGLAERHVGPDGDADRTARRTRRAIAGDRGGGGRRHRGARVRRRSRPLGVCRPALLRVRHRRHPARRARRRLADLGLGPEREPLRDLTGGSRRRGGGGRLASRPARPPARERHRLRHRRDDGQPGLPRRRAPRRAHAPRPGPRTATVSPAARP